MAAPESVPQYLFILEQLEFTNANNAVIASAEALRLEKNVNKLTDHIKVEAATLYKQNACHMLNATTYNAAPALDVAATYEVYMQHVLHVIVSSTNFQSEQKEDLLSSRQINLCIEAIQDLADYSLRQALHSCFYQTELYKTCKCRKQKISSNTYCFVVVEFFYKMLQISQFNLANAMDLVARDYMAYIFSLLLENELQQRHLETSHLLNIKEKLSFLWLHLNKLNYFRNIMLFKGMPQIHPALQKYLHRELLHKLAAQDGFCTLVVTMHTTTQAQGSDDKRSLEIIAKIVAFPKHTLRFQLNMINQIWQFLELCLKNVAMADSMAVGLLTLRRLYDLSAENQQIISNNIYAMLKNFIAPQDLLSGLIIMEHQTLCHAISLMYHLFCTSMVECLPSSMLISYLPLMLQLYYNIPSKFKAKHHAASLLLRCLNNRQPLELQNILEKLYKQQFSSEWHNLHARLLIMPSEQQTELQLQVTSLDFQQEFNVALAMPELLMSSEHHNLSYNVFMSLLQLITPMLNQTNSNSANASIDLLQSEQELLDFINARYPFKLELLLSLNTLISHQPLKAQIAENSAEFMKYLESLLQQRANSLSKVQPESLDHTLLIMLTLTEEMLYNSSLSQHTFHNFIPLLQTLEQQSVNHLVLQRIRTLLEILQGNAHVAATTLPANTKFLEARALIETRLSHLQVYGIQILLDLIRQKDSYTISNGHIIIALALTTLKDRESYTFLNCVRLFVGLINIMEAEVLDLLMDEYLNENAEMDFRLLVGEVVLKVGQELGVLSYKYKNALLNCFMYGARSPLNEFRMSAFANLSQICKILCYQVHHFFEELLNLINAELSSGPYMPSKRAAVLVLSELLTGMENLLDFEQMLLPLYRILREIESDENCDEKMRIHAANGLKVLAEKCKKLLFPEQQPQKEIKIMGIKDLPNRKSNLKQHILEMN